MSDMKLKEFQHMVSDLLLRHRSLLDVVTKYQQSNSTVNRSVIKAITECGCIEVNAKKQEFSENMTYDQAKESLKTHITGKLCEQCNDMIKNELGKNLFYMSALCNLLDIDLEEVVSRESKKCSTLGFFNMS
jgi:NTP pyrophosphatase (non-canonical NTP hydrolase)